MSYLANKIVVVVVNNSAPLSHLSVNIPVVTVLLLFFFVFIRTNKGSQQMNGPSLRAAEDQLQLRRC